MEWVFAIIFWLWVGDIVDDINKHRKKIRKELNELKRKKPKSRREFLANRKRRHCRRL